MTARRTPRGRGSVFYDEARGRWEVDLRKDHRRYRAFAATEAEAWAKRDALLARARLGMEPGQQPTLEAFVRDEWLPSLRVRPKTLATYRSHLTRHVLPELGAVRLDQLSPGHLRRLFADLERSRLAPRTVSHVRAILRNALRRAEQDGLVARNVAVLTDAIPVPNVERRTLSLVEARKFLESLEGDRMEALYLVAITLGLRQSELLGLRWKDVSGETLQVRQTLHRVDGQAIIHDPKSERSRRSIPLPPDVAEALRRHRARQRAEYVETGARPEHDLVFTNQRGRALLPSTLLRDLYRRLDALGIERVRFHDLRHAAASLLHGRGFTPREVMAILGHASFVTSMNTYAHSDADELRAKMEQLAGWRQG